MIKSVGIDLGGIGEYKVRCLDENDQMFDGFGFDISRSGLIKLEERLGEYEYARSFRTGLSFRTSEKAIILVYRAHSLRRVIERYIENSLSSMVLCRDLQLGDVVEIDLDIETL